MLSFSNSLFLSEAASVKSWLASVFILGGTAMLLFPTSSEAHGFVGNRFFPATLSTEDPFVANEASFPTVSSIVVPDSGGTRVTSVSVDFALKLTDRVALSVGERFLTLSPHSGGSTNGFDNLGLGVKFQAWENAPHEAVVSLSLDADIGGTGGRSVGADSFTIWTPGILFGKGFGDLPDSLAALKPLALTGGLGLSIPGNASTRTFTTDPVTGSLSEEVEVHSDTLHWSAALEYSIIDLQARVKDLGLPKPLDRMIPLVELALDTPLDRGQGGATTGTVNPGVIWSGRYCQFGAEALIPINSRSGSNIGFIAQVHLYLDDLFPKALGKPLMGR